MNEKPLLSIGDFALATTLSAQTLRYYHGEGLLVPAEVDEQTGYRAYAFSQVHQALMIMALRGAGVSVRDVRDVVNSPDQLEKTLAEHRTSLDRHRALEDAALAQGQLLATGWPSVEDRCTPAAVSGTRRVGGRAIGADGLVVPPQVQAAARALHRELVESGVETIGRPWCAYVLDTAEDKMKALTPDGPDWIVAVDRDPDAPDRAWPAGVDGLRRPRRHELVVHLTGRLQTPLLAAAFEYLTRTALESGLVPDLGRPRYVLDGDRLELAVSVGDS